MTAAPHDPHECDGHEHHGDEPGHVHNPHECDGHAPEKGVSKGEGLLSPDVRIEVRVNMWE